MTNYNIYQGVFALSVVVITLAWRSFFTGITFGDLKRMLYTLAIDTKRSARWDRLGELILRGENDVIFRLYFFQYQLLHVVKWFFSALVVASIVWLVNVALHPERTLQVIKDHQPNQSIDFTESAAIMLVISVVIFGFFLTGYKARLNELAKQMAESVGP